MAIFLSSAGRSVVIVAGLGVLWAAWAGPVLMLVDTPLAGHMLQHLVVMNVAALLLAVGLPRQWSGRGPVVLIALTLLQMAALWIWHAPALFEAAHHSVLLQTLMQASLFLVALFFWRCVLAQPPRSGWPAIGALLVTAKTFCLLGAILAFSRRPLYVLHGFAGEETVSALADQQLAGMLMISSCVLVYVAAAVTLFARWLESIPAPARSVSIGARADVVAVAD